MESPAATLTSPSPRQPIPDLAEWIGKGPDFVSPSGLVLLGLETFCGVNPFDYVTEFLAGDWAAVATAGDALRKVADFNAAFGTAVTDGKLTMLQGWSGQAADAAGRYFDSLPTALQQQASALSSAAGECQAIAMGMHETAEGIKGGLQILVDLAIVWASYIALAGAISWTGFGGAAAASAAAAIAAIGASKWVQLVGVLGEAMMAARAFVGTVSGLMAPLGEMRDLPLPAGAYDNPQA